MHFLNQEKKPQKIIAVLLLILNMTHKQNAALQMLGLYS